MTLEFSNSLSLYGYAVSRSPYGVLHTPSIQRFYSRASHHLDLTLLRRDFLEALRVHADAVVCSVSEEDVPYIDVLKSALVVLDG